MVPEKDKVYDIEFEDDGDVWCFRARCICEQPLENGCYVFEALDVECSGEEIEAHPDTITREVCAEYAR